MAVVRGWGREGDFEDAVAGVDGEALPHAAVLVEVRFEEVLTQGEMTGEQVRGARQLQAVQPHAGGRPHPPARRRGPSDLRVGGHKADLPRGPSLAHFAASAASNAGQSRSTTHAKTQFPPERAAHNSPTFFLCCSSAACASVAFLYSAMTMRPS